MEWETDALENEIEAEWEMLRTYYIEAGSVATPVLTASDDGMARRRPRGRRAPVWT